MQWNTLFTKIDDIAPDETRKLLESYPPGSFQLLDVRQPNEYERIHIPGASLIPLSELPERLGELDRDREVIVYCRSGVRSRSGCQILQGAGFAKVLNMKGGILAWNGQTATGDDQLGLDLFTPGAYSSALTMAYAMEQGLGLFYQALADRAVDSVNRELLNHMAKLEDGHMARLKSRYAMLQLPADVAPRVAEGGLDVDALLAHYGNQLASIETIIQAGMMFEAQAFDLYSRLAARENDPDLRQFYRDMAAEEQTHLARLARELERRLS